MCVMDNIESHLAVCLRERESLSSSPARRYPFSPHSPRRDSRSSVCLANTVAQLPPALCFREGQRSIVVLGIFYNSPVLASTLHLSLL